MQTNQSSRLNQIADFIGEYIRSNPGYSPQDLAVVLEGKFCICSKEADELSLLVSKELQKTVHGLAAIELNLTYNCNLICEYCFVHDKSPADRMSFTTAKQAIDLLIERTLFSNIYITLLGGEPLLEFDLIKVIVSYALEQADQRSLQVHWAITSNGTLINEEILQFFAKNNINILLSIDGGPNTHDRYRRTKSGEGTWQRIVDLIPLIRKYQPYIGARMTVSTEAIDSMIEDFHHLVEVGVNHFIIAPAQGSICWSKAQIEQYGINLEKIYHDYQTLKSTGTKIFIEEFESDINVYNGYWGCRAGTSSIAVAPNGDISPCSKLLGLTDHAGKCIIGNVNSHFNENLLEPFRNAINRQPKSCKHCTHQCSGGCYAVNYEQTGNHFIPSEEQCLFWVVKQDISKLLKSTICKPT